MSLGSRKLNLKIKQFSILHVIYVFLSLCVCVYLQKFVPSICLKKNLRANAICVLRYGF